MYQNLSTRHDWPVKKAIIDWPIRMKRNSKRTSGNWLSPLGAQNINHGAASQTLLTEVKFRLRRRLDTECNHALTKRHALTKSLFCVTKMECNRFRDGDIICHSA